MKKIIFSFLIGIFFASTAWSQVFNFAQLPGPSGNVFSLDLGYDHAFAATLAYHRQFDTPRPLLLGGALTIPSGNVFLDDWQLKFGGQYDILQAGNLHLAGKAQFVARQRNLSHANHFGWGTDLALIGGWYKQRYFLSAEIGYDRTWVSKLQHGAAYLENYPGAVDGWYRGNADNIYLGLQGGYSWQKLDLNLRLGYTARPNGSVNLLPFHALIGINFRI